MALSQGALTNLKLTSSRHMVCKFNFGVLYLVNHCFNFETKIILLSRWIGRSMCDVQCVHAFLYCPTKHFIFTFWDFFFSIEKQVLILNADYGYFVMIVMTIKVISFQGNPLRQIKAFRLQKG